jgi:hypothetical protein
VTGCAGPRQDRRRNRGPGGVSAVGYREGRPSAVWALHPPRQQRRRWPSEPTGRVGVRHPRARPQSKPALAASGVRSARASPISTPPGEAPGVTLGLDCFVRSAGRHGAMSANTASRPQPSNMAQRSTLPRSATSPVPAVFIPLPVLSMGSPAVAHSGRPPDRACELSGAYAAGRKDRLPGASACRRAWAFAFTHIFLWRAGRMRTRTHNRKREDAR